MAGHARYTALLDACVLYPIAIADSLISIASAGLFAAKWSIKIEEEWMRNLEANRPDLKGKLDIRLEKMRKAVPDWEVLQEAWQPLICAITLPDIDDRHVLAAAIAGHADCIVTTNLKDFPTSQVSDVHKIEVLHPDRFILHQWDLNPIAVISAFKRMRARWKKPEKTAEEFVQAIDKNGLSATASRLKEVADLI
jgi:predicted nucleic acid-binding protein